jgi:hypothetical protein
MERKRRGR